MKTNIVKMFNLRQESYPPGKLYKFASPTQNGKHIFAQLALFTQSVKSIFHLSSF